MGAGPQLLQMWAAFGAAFLTKGPPGLLPLAAIACSWFAIVAARDPALLRYFLVDEVLKRVASADHDRHAEWFGAYIYAPTLLFGTLPWTVFLIGGLLRARRSLLSATWWRASARSSPWPVFPLLWLLLPLAIVVLVRSRLPLYVLPLCVPLALLAARELQRHDPPLRRWGVALAIWCVVLAEAEPGALLVVVARHETPFEEAVRSAGGTVEEVGRSGRYVVFRLSATGRGARPAS